jgi:hypothetical protein
MVRITGLRPWSDADPNAGPSVSHFDVRRIQNVTLAAKFIVGIAGETSDTETNQESVGSVGEKGASTGLYPRASELLSKCANLFTAVL